MGTMSFLIPAGLPPQAGGLLGRACLAGGYDRTPVPTDVRVQADRLLVQRQLDESCQLQLPWTVEGIGQVMASTATLIERAAPYHLPTELARGKLNQVRSQAAEWCAAGLQTSPDFDRALSEATHLLGQALVSPPSPGADDLAARALAGGYRAADLLMQLYVDQLFFARRQRTPVLDSFLACRAAAPPTVVLGPLLQETFSRISVPLTWRQVEPRESDYNWAPADAVMRWAEEAEVPVTAGPLIDFSPSGLPEWLLPWAGNPSSLLSFLCDYVETVVSRYRGRVRRWVVCAAANHAEILGLQEDDLLRMTAGLVEAALQIDPQIEAVVSLAQPWGEYLASEDHTYSPFVFADTLVRINLPLAALELEWFMGVSPRGSYCRDLLDASRMLDLFAMLGVPLQVALSYPSAKGLDPLADPHQVLSSAGYWQGGFTPETQADWAARFAALALSKPYVAGVVWHQLSDAAPHLVPHGGLADAKNQAKPALNALRQMRDAYLR